MRSLIRPHLRQGMKFARFKRQLKTFLLQDLVNHVALWLFAILRHRNTLTYLLAYVGSDGLTIRTMMFQTKNCGRLEALAAQQKPGYWRVSALETLLTILCQTLTNLWSRHSCWQLMVLTQMVRIIDELSTSCNSDASLSLTIVTVRSCTSQPAGTSFHFYCFERYRNANSKPCRLVAWFPASSVVGQLIDMNELG